VKACFGSLVLSVLSRWLIQFCLYLSLTSCIPEISSSCLMSSLRECIRLAPSRDCMTLTMVVGLVWSNESRSYAGGSVATGRASHARLVRDEDPD